MTCGGGVELTFVIDNVVRLREQQLWPHPSPLELARAAVRAGAGGVLLSLQAPHVAITDRNWQMLGGLDHATLCLAAAPRADVLRRIAESPARRCVLVPDSRHEHSSGGALALTAIRDRLPALTRTVERSEVELAARIDPDPGAVAACRDAGLAAVELNTAGYALAVRAHSRTRRLEDLCAAAQAAANAGLRVSVRGGLDYRNIAALLGQAPVAEVRIGQALVAQALFDGIDASIARMRHLLDGALH